MDFSKLKGARSLQDMFTTRWSSLTLTLTSALERTSRAVRQRWQSSRLWFALFRLSESVTYWKKINNGKFPIWKYYLTRHMKEDWEGQVIKPPWMGVSHYSFDLDMETYYLIPFNYLNAWRRQLYDYLRWKFYPLGYELERHKIYAAGVREGNYNARVRHTFYNKGKLDFGDPSPEDVSRYPHHDKL